MAGEQERPAGSIPVLVGSRAHGETRWLQPGGGERFHDLDGGPEMVVAPAGSFLMGSPEGYDYEDPQHKVTIGRPFAVGRLHVTVDQFAAFVRETGYEASSTCWTLEKSHWWTASTFVQRADRSWRNPGFAQDGSHPVVGVSWDDARAYTGWLAEKTDKRYRLPSEAEFEYAARAGTSTPFWWGSSITPDQANYDGRYPFSEGGSKGEYRRRTVPAGSFAANPWGLCDVHGNAWQWMEDCWHENYNGAPADGSAWITACSGSDRVTRGGSWFNDPWSLRATARSWEESDASCNVGFRVARTLDPGP